MANACHAANVGAVLVDARDILSHVGVTQRHEKIAAYDTNMRMAMVVSRENMFSKTPAGTSGSI